MNTILLLLFIIGIGLLSSSVCTPNPTVNPTTQQATIRPISTTVKKSTTARTTKTSSKPRPTTATKKQSSTTTIRSATASPASEAAACQAINCNFAGGMCSYTNGNDSSSGTSWQTLSTSIGNRDTGVPGPPNGTSHYVGTQVSPGQRSVLQSAPYTLIDGRLLQFEYHESTENVVLKACTNDRPYSCRSISNLGVGPTDRQWKKGSYALPANALLVQFLAENSGDNLASAGIANVQLMRPGLTAIDAPTPAC